MFSESFWMFIQKHPKNNYNNITGFLYSLDKFAVAGLKVYTVKNKKIIYSPFLYLTRFISWAKRKLLQ